MSFREPNRMTPMSQEDIEWFKSTFHPIPRPELPDDSVEYSLYWIPTDPTFAFVDDAAVTRLRLQEAQKSASELTKSLLKNYIWQREAFGLEISKEDGEQVCSHDSKGSVARSLAPESLLTRDSRGYITTGKNNLWRFY